MKITAPKITLNDLTSKTGQQARYQKLAVSDGVKVRFSIILDTSYPAQSRAKVESWTANGWTEVWTLDTGDSEKCGGRPDWKQTTERVVNEWLKELAKHAQLILS